MSRKISTNQTRKVYVVGGSTGYANWLPRTELCANMEEADVVMFTGGEDINPELYGEPRLSCTYYNPKRDKRELEAFAYARELNKPLIGTCRGAQFFCAMAGGVLIQDQQDLHFIHPVYLSNGKTIQITSMHHQAMYPFKMPSSDYKILGWARDHSTHHMGGKGEEMNPEVECEIVYFPKIKALGIQGHPECLWPSDKPEYAETFFNLHEMYENLLDNSL